MLSLSKRENQTKQNISEYFLCIILWIIYSSNRDLMPKYNKQAISKKNKSLQLTNLTSHKLNNKQNETKKMCKDIEDCF